MMRIRCAAPGRGTLKISTRERNASGTVSRLFAVRMKMMRLASKFISKNSSLNVTAVPGSNRSSNTGKTG